METAAFVILLISNAAALLQAVHYRRRANRFLAIAYALSPDHKITLWPCDCRHLLLHSGKPTKICCDTEHSGARCQPLGETI